MTTRFQKKRPIVHGQKYATLNPLNGRCLKDCFFPSPAVGAALWLAIVGLSDSVQKVSLERTISARRQAQPRKPNVQKLRLSARNLESTNFPNRHHQLRPQLLTCRRLPSWPFPNRQRHRASAIR